MVPPIDSNVKTFEKREQPQNGTRWLRKQWTRLIDVKRHATRDAVACESVGSGMLSRGEEYTFTGLQRLLTLRPSIVS